MLETLAIRSARLLTPPTLKQLIRLPGSVWLRRRRRRRRFARNRCSRSVSISHARAQAFVLHFKAFISS